MALLQINDISKTFNQGYFHRHITKAVDNVSFSINQGETFGLVGESGCGKSTLGRIICRLIKEDSGDIYFDNQHISAMKDSDFKKHRRDIQILFQHPDTSLNPRMKVLDSLREPLILHKLAHKSQLDDIIREHIVQFGIQPELLTRQISQISGGQVQRIVLARIMLLNPKLIILDEPTSMLDVSVQAQMMELLKQLQQDTNVSYLLISHDLDLVSISSHQLGIMHKGKLIDIGTPKEIFAQTKNKYSKELLASFEQMKL